MAATITYLYGLKNTSFAAAWPQPFPSKVAVPSRSLAWALPVNAFWFRGEEPQGISEAPLIVSPPLRGLGVGPSAASAGVVKWGGLAHNLGASSWGLVALALSFPPLADLLCLLVGFWLFLGADERQEQLFCMTVAATMPKHIAGMPLAIC